jgi:hypothetical protein
MFRIGDEQAHELGQSAYRSFQQRLAGHLRKFFPAQMASMSGPDTEAFITRCVEAARRHGLTSEQSVAYFSHLPLLLGEDFEANRRCRFATAVLGASAGAPQERVKIAMLLAHQLKAKGALG